MRKTLVLVVVLLIGCHVAASADDRAGWPEFKREFMSPEGRIIDYRQDQISHSEGQGWAMLLAAAHDDRDAFRLLWKWTKDNLQVRRTDRLFAWSWGRRANGRWGIIDLNNAADGDTCIAMALLDAADRWGADEYRAAASEVIGNIRENLVVESGGKLCLLPGYYGFVNPDGLVLNASYFVFPAYPRFSRIDDSRFWTKLHQDSLDVLSRAAYTRLNLPADWIVYDGTNATIHHNRSELFGYEAVRVPLYLAWDGAKEPLSRMNGYLDLVEALGYLPESVNLVDASVSLNDAPAGMYAVMARSADELGRKKLGLRLHETAQRKTKAEDKDYYSRILFLLSEIKKR